MSNPSNRVLLASTTDRRVMGAVCVGFMFLFAPGLLTSTMWFGRWPTLQAIPNDLDQKHRWVRRTGSKGTYWDFGEVGIAVRKRRKPELEAIATTLNNLDTSTPDGF